MKLFLFIFAIGMNAFAEDASKVCHEIIAQQSNSQARLSTLNLIRGLVFPSKIVQMKQMINPVDYVISKQGHDHIIINILKVGDLNLDLAELHKKLEIYKKIENSIKENGFAEKASQLSTFEECMQLSLDAYLEFSQFMKLSRELDHYSSYRKQFERLESFRFVKKKMAGLMNQGWNLHEVLDLKTLSKVMMERPEQLVIISHATSNGVIIDTNNNALPISVFSNTPESLRKLSLFSCYTDKLQKTYQIEKLVAADRFDFVYPVVKSVFKSYFEDSTPLLALGALSKFHKKRKMLPVKNLEKNCSIKFDQATSVLALGVYVNNQFIGLLKDIKQGEQKIYCDLLKNENSISFNLVDKMTYLPSDVVNIPNSLVIKNENDSNRMNLKHFFRENKYLSSKTIRE